MKIKNPIYSIFILTSILILISSFIACGSSSGGDSESEEVGQVPTAVPENQVVTTQFFGENGNLYKPRSDEVGAGQGNLVVLFSSAFTNQFESCEIRKANGEVVQLLCINDQPWTQIPFSCFSNGNRQTWRANFPCNEAGEVKVTCKDMNQEVIFTVPESSRSFVCNRFG